MYINPFKSGTMFSFWIEPFVLRAVIMWTLHFGYRQ